MEKKKKSEIRKNLQGESPQTSPFSPEEVTRAKLHTLGWLEKLNRPEVWRNAARGLQSPVQVYLTSWLWLAISTETDQNDFHSELTDWFNWCENHLHHHFESAAEIWRTSLSAKPWVSQTDRGKQKVSLPYSYDPCCHEGGRKPQARFRSCSLGQSWFVDKLQMWELDLILSCTLVSRLLRILGFTRKCELPSKFTFCKWTLTDPGLHNKFPFVQPGNKWKYMSV